MKAKFDKDTELKYFFETLPELFQSAQKIQTTVPLYASKKVYAQTTLTFVRNTQEGDIIGEVQSVTEQIDQETQNDRPTTSPEADISSDSPQPTSTKTTTPDHSPTPSPPPPSPSPPPPPPPDSQPDIPQPTTSSQPEATIPTTQLEKPSTSNPPTTETPSTAAGTQEKETERQKKKKEHHPSRLWIGLKDASSLTNIEVGQLLKTFAKEAKTRTARKTKELSNKNEE